MRNKATVFLVIGVLLFAIGAYSLYTYFSISDRANPIPTGIGPVIASLAMFYLFYQARKR